MISAKNLHFGYPGAGRESQKAIDGISVEIQKGERVALMGSNGCGKSTLLKLIAGLVDPDQGEIRVDGSVTSEQSFKSGMGRKIGVVFQNPENQLLSVTVEREIAVGLENHSFDRAMIKQRVDNLLADADLEKLRYKQISRLSGGEKQMVSLLSVLVLEPDILLLDEPFSHLDYKSRMYLHRQLQEIIEKREITVLMATQDFEDALAMERLILMKGGKIESEGHPETYIESPGNLISAGVFPPIEPMLKSINRHTFENAPDVKKRANMGKSSDAFMSVRNLSFAWRSEDKSELIKNLNMELAEGCVTGIAGPNGCGKSTLALILAGLVKPHAGEIRVNGKRAVGRNLLQTVVYIFQSPERGLFAQTLYEDIAFGPRNMGVSKSEADGAVKKYMNIVGLEFDSFRDREPSELSGGEQRLAAIAGGLATGKKLIVLDEPVEELDFYGRQRVAEIIDNLKAENHAVCVISHDSDFLLHVCDEINFLQNGSIRTFAKFDLLERAGIFADISLRTPAVIRVAAEQDLAPVFKAKGIDSLAFLLDNPDLLRE